MSELWEGPDGGRAGPAGLNDLWAGDITSSTWSELSTSAAGTGPSVRTLMGMAVADGVLYVHGGTNGTTDCESLAWGRAGWSCAVGTPSSLFRCGRWGRREREYRVVCCFWVVLND